MPGSILVNQCALLFLHPCLERQGGDLRIIKLIRRWLKPCIMEQRKLMPNEIGAPQGGSVSVLLSNLCLHQILDLWFQRIVNRRLRKEAYLIRYIHDFVIYFQYRDDAERVQVVLSKRLSKFAHALEPRRTKLIRFGRSSQRESCRTGQRVETFSLLGFVHYCTRKRKGNFKLGHKMEKSRLRRSIARLMALKRESRHRSLKEQAEAINRFLRGYYAHYGLAGNFWSLQCTAGPSATGTRCAAAGAGGSILRGRSSVECSSDFRCSIPASG